MTNLFKLASRFLSVTILSLAILSTSGCLLFAGAAAGGAAAATAYYMGQLKGNIKATPEAIKDATLKAFKKLTISVTSESPSSNVSAKICGNTFDGKSVEVDITRKDDTSCDILIKVGSFGNQEQSQRIFDQIKAYL